MEDQDLDQDQEIDVSSPGGGRGFSGAAEGHDSYTEDERLSPSRSARSAFMPDMGHKFKADSDQEAGLASPTREVQVPVWIEALDASSGRWVFSHDAPLLPCLSAS